MASSDDELKKIFEIYCSFGEPMNTKNLKSSKLIKLLRDCGLIKGTSKLREPKAAKQKAKQVQLVETDILFKQLIH